MQSLAGVGQLEEHMREEHGDSVTKKVKANFKNFLGKAKTFGKKIHVGGAGVDVSEGAAAVATAKRDELEEEEEEEDWRSASLSGINPELWPEQEFGEERERERERATVWRLLFVSRLVDMYI